MLTSIITKLPLLVTFCLLNTAIILPAPALEICETNTVKTVKLNNKIANRDYRNKGRRYYNQDGDDGNDGRAGRNGRDGENRTITANSSPINLDLSGTNGEDGEDGEHASRPRCRRNYSRNITSNIHAPDGGDGGDGGRGGDGGNGGSLMVYYSNLADLKNIFVRTAGGEGGRGGRGGEGTRGCYCHRRRWKVKTCTGKPGESNYRCTEKTYRCYDGSNGRDGSDGRDGKRGNLGILSIINSTEPLRNDLPSRKVAISQLANEEINLSKNKWNLRQGATALLAPGSIIADKYREFERRLEGSFKLIWQEKKPIVNFANQSVNLTLNDNQEISIEFPDNIWFDGNSTFKNKVTEYTLNYAIPEQEVTKLAVAEFTGSRQNLNLKIVDLGGHSEIINTRFKVKYRAKDNFSGFNYQTFYDGDIPTELVSRNYNRFTLDLGKLNIPNSALSSGQNVEIEVIAIRFLGERLAQQTIRWQGNVR
jgi:hypothetical protein